MNPWNQKIGCGFLSSLHIWAAAIVMRQSLTSLSPCRSVECLFKERKSAWEGQMVRSAGLLRARHECGLSSLRSLCRLMPAWISVNLCQASRIKENIYKALLCYSSFEKNQEVSPSLALLERRLTLHCSVNIQNGRGCDRAADVWSWS